MKRLSFSYDMQLMFDAPVTGHHFTIKCIPKSDDRQKIEQFNIRIEPKCHMSESKDSYGNECLYGHMESEHNLFSIHTEGIISTGLSDVQSIENIHKLNMYKYPTQLVRPGKEIKRFFATLALDKGMNKLEKAIEIAKRLYEEMEYVAGSTNMATTAEEAFAARKGVCQDYAHIMISLCQLAHIPARYVVGFMKGEGESHAWVEIVAEDGIYAIDPTNNLVVDDEHIRISCGRDSSDCLINNGYFYSNAKQNRDIKLIVEDIT